MAPLLGDWTASAAAPESSILYIDCYDSFSYNVVSMVEEVLDARVTVMTNDAKWPDGNMVEFLQHFDAVVLGPGPGDPNVPKDVGIMADIWNLSSSNIMPVLGICLGFQSLCLHHGVPIGRLPEPLHGQVHRITTAKRDIFENLQDLEVTLYHSLYAIFDQESHDTPRNRTVSLKPELDVLAWFSLPENGPSPPATWIPMAVRHKTKPFWGVQFHPESCKSDREACHALLRNWWKMAVKYNKMHDREGYGRLPVDIIRPSSEDASLSDIAYTVVRWSESSSNHSASRIVTCQFDAEEICELFNEPGTPAVLFRSNSKHSIISVPSPGSWRLEYYAQRQSLLLQRLSSSNSSKSKDAVVEAVLSVSQVWDTLRYLMDYKKVDSGDSNVPFWAGLLGYFSYELGLACLAHPKQKGPGDGNVNGSQEGAGSEDPPDVSLLWTERSIVVDHETDRVTVQSTREGDDQPAGWLDQALKMLKTSCMDARTIDNFAADNKLLDSVLSRGLIQFPSEDVYLRQVEACKDELRAGESYELCLTCETSITLPSPEAASERVEFPWKLYERLRKYNPAAFSAFARLGNVKIVSSSPECFLNWDRHSTLEMKPMKGTVRKSNSMTLERAREILGSTKEMAENLMIADLIRHDLYGICGAGNVHVEKLLDVEDHGQVYQMITHVKGRVDPLQPGYAAKSLPRLQSSNMSGHGLTALQRCLPPGSMTGAPKERSCMHLSSIEGRKRGIYSGVMGFLDLGGGGSFSVLIRTAFTSSDDQDKTQKWRIGAGGAVTMLSSAEGEWDEMLTKLRTVCGSFMPSYAV